MFWHKFQLLLCWLGEAQSCDHLEFHRPDGDHQA